MADYLSIWMYNSRPRMRVFLCYFLIFLFFFIFSDVMIYLYNKSLYKPMESKEVNVENTGMTVTINEAEASNVNGTVRGTIKNDTEEKIVYKYLKFDFYTPRGVNAGTKYLKIDTLQTGEEKEYELGFRYNNVTSVKISLAADDDVHEATPEELEVTPAFGPAGLIQMLLLGQLFG